MAGSEESCVLGGMHLNARPELCLGGGGLQGVGADAAVLHNAVRSPTADLMLRYIFVVIRSIALTLR